jgi:PAS domain S-box-containing protein
LVGNVLAQASVLLLCLWLVFALEPLPRYNAFYLCFLPLIWICLRHGLPGATLATLAITMGSLIGMHITGASTELVVSFLMFELTVAVVGLGLGSAVTRRNEVEQSLVVSENRFDRVISGAQLGLWDWDVRTRQAVYNQRWAEMLGYRLDEIEPTHGSWEKLVHPADRERVQRALAVHLEGRSPIYEVEFRIRTKDQHWRWIHSRGSVVARDAEQKPLLVSGTHLDITDRKRAEAEAHRLLQIIEATTDFVLTTDTRGEIIHANAALVALLDGADAASLRGRMLEEIFPPAASRAMLDEAIPTTLKTGSWHGEILLRTPRGREVPVSQVAMVHRDAESDTPTLSFVMRDISRQKKTEAENIENERRILQVQKSESLGVLAGGIAHDFNNLLTAMLGNANLARLDLPAESPVHGPLVQIENAAARAAELCQQMLAYAGRSPLTFTEIDLTSLIEDTHQLLQVSIGKKIKVDLELTRPLAYVRAAPAQMQQVIMNLALNASEAIGDNAGRIAIRTSSRTLTSAELRERYHATNHAPGNYVILEVEDTGCGIPPEALARIFEPFFTTKFTGHGLGLAAVMGIVKSHAGAIHVTSAVGRGSVFRLLFPAVKAPVAAPQPPIENAGEWTGRGTVLVVDDEPGVRAIVARVVETFGFTAQVARDGLEGVELFREHAGSLRLVLLDLTMPRMDGEQAFLEMNRIRPEVPVVLMSGFSEKLTVERFSSPKPAGFLAKPFDRKTLQAKILPLVGAQMEKV